MKYFYQKIVSSSPSQPGIYFFINKSNQIIYIGKAKNIKKRLSSHFSISKYPTIKQTNVVKQTSKINWIATNTEMESLILEAEQIKKHQPRYNVMLKDNKTYPFIKITTKEPYPRIFKTRKLENDGNLYFGPYINIGKLDESISFLRRLFKIRACSFVLPAKKNIKPCLDYHIKQCDGCCIKNKISSAEYKTKNANPVIQILSGKSKPLKEMKKKMQQYSLQQEYEKALEIKNQIELFQQLSEKQYVANLGNNSVDIIGTYEGDNGMQISIMEIREGTICSKKNFFLSSSLFNNSMNHRNSRFHEFLRSYYFNILSGIPQEIILPEFLHETQEFQLFLQGLNFPDIQIALNPESEKKQKWISMSCANAKFEYFANNAINKNENSIALQTLQNILNLPHIPFRIDGIDISNTEQHHPVGVVVSFEKGQANKKAYRVFNINSIKNTPDDYKSIFEVVHRKYKSKPNQTKTTPDIILVDGGKGQVKVAQEALNHLNLKQRIPIIGLAKKEEKLFVSGHSESLNLKASSPCLKMLQRIRNEAHRFCNALHTKKRWSSGLTSVLEQIPGIGKQKRKILLEHFGSLANIQNSTQKNLSKIPGISDSTAKTIISFFTKKQTKYSQH